LRVTINVNFRQFFLLVLLCHVVLLTLELTKKKHRQALSKSRPVNVRILRVEQVRQIVESEDPQAKVAPKEKAYLSDKDRAFDRETRARVVDKFQRSDKRPHGEKELSLADLGGELGRVNPFAAAAKTAPAATERSATNDFLPEVPLGDLTQLNTVEFKYYGYFHRLKEKLEGFWGRSVQEKVQYLAAKGSSLASGEEHFTAVRLVLNPDGKIIEVVLLGSSGIREFDNAALESFNAAGPFPNPPKSLIVEGRVTIEWGFNVSS